MTPIETDNLKRLIQQTADGLLIIGPDGVIAFANPAARRLLDAAQGEAPSGLPTEPGLHEWELPNGRTVEIHLAEFSFRNRQGRVASIRDITTRKLAESELREVAVRLEAVNAQLEQVATHDSLTGLYNRRGLSDALDIELHRCRRSGRPLVTILVDCDDFKRVNTKLGHTGGDFVLQAIAERLSQALRRTDVIARIGGDEFLALLPETRIAEGAYVGEKLRLAVSSSPVLYGGQAVEVSVSIGLADVRPDTCSIEELLSDTQGAMLRSKTLGKNSVSIASDSEPGPSKPPSGLIMVRETLRRGDRFRHRAQSLHELSSGEVVGWEIFSRGPNGPFEMPNDFFRVAREAAMLTLVDLSCLKSCLKAANLDELPGRLHINVFPSTLTETFGNRLCHLLESFGPVDRICLELSEHQFVGDPGGLRSGLAVLRKAGVKLAIDDVGFGRTSLEALILLEPDFVKIDRSYISGAGQDSARMRQVERLVNAVTTLGAVCVAEGIETAEDLEAIKNVGVTFGQGFFWGPLRKLSG